MITIQEHLEHARQVLAPRYGELTELVQAKSGVIFAGHKGGDDGPPVAVKVAYPMEAETHANDAVVRFAREAELAALLSHPNILRQLPPEELDGVQFCEMDLAGQIRLDQLVVAELAPTFDRILTIMQELAEALDYAHARGIVHGALSPSKVLLDAAGHVRLTGFLLHKNTEATHQALTPAAIGDPAFMAPEQWRLPRVDQRVDIYSAGIIAYELCTGHRRVQLDGTGVPEIMPMDLAPNHPLRPGIPQYVSEVIRHATSREPAARPLTVRAMVDAMRHHDVALGHSLPTDRPHVPRQRQSVWMLAVIVLLAAALAVMVLPAAQRQKMLTWTKLMTKQTVTAVDDAWSRLF